MATTAKPPTIRCPNCGSGQKPAAVRCTSCRGSLTELGQQYATAAERDTDATWLLAQGWTESGRDDVRAASGELRYIASYQRVAGQVAANTMVREYADEEAMQAEAASLLTDGWSVDSRTNQGQPGPASTLLSLGFVALQRKPRYRIIVTYQRLAET